MRLFSKNENGLLVEIHPSQEAQARVGRRWSHAHIEGDVLWTAEEEAARDAEEALAQQVKAAAATAEQESATARAGAVDKLRALGLSQDEITALVR